MTTALVSPLKMIGSGDTLVMLHGFTGSAAYWLYHQPGLTSRFRLLLPDLPGHGAAVEPEYLARASFADCAADLLATLQAHGVERCPVLGYSMGGRLALFLALKYPEFVSYLILESASPGIANEDERAARADADDRLAQAIETRGMLWFVDYWESLPLWASQSRLDPTVRAALRSRRLAGSTQGFATSLRQMGTGVQPSLWGVLPTLTIPTLLISGREDAKFTAIAEDMAALLPDARHAIIDQAGHAVHLEQPEAYHMAIRGFLDTSVRVSR